MKLIKLIMLSILILICYSCEEEFLDRTPNQSVGLNVAITDEQSLDVAALGLYSNLQSSLTFGADFNTVQAILTDNGYVSVVNSNRFTDLFDYTHARADAGRIAGPWNSLYRVIANANNVLAAKGTIDDVAAVPGTPGDRFGEAHVIRALALFQLVNWYARPVGSGLNQDLGVAIPLTFEAGTSIERSTVAQVYEQIDNDLMEAISIMVTEPGRLRLGPTAARLLLARSKLYQEDYPAAMTLAQQVLSNGAGFSPMNRSEVVGYYANENSTNETLFQVEFNANDNPGSNDGFSATWTLEGTYNQNFASRDFYDLIPATDIRKSLYTDNLSAADYPDAVLGVDVRKFTTLDRDMPVLRMAEAKFIEIEAMFHSNPAGARTELNTWVSTNRDSGFNTTASGQALFDVITEQRRIEFAFEGHRWFDMNRLGLDIVRDPNCIVSCNIPFSDFRRVYPIPRNEIITNVSGNFPQNPNY